LFSVYFCSSFCSCFTMIKLKVVLLHLVWYRYSLNIILWNRLSLAMMTSKMHLSRLKVAYTSRGEYQIEATLSSSSLFITQGTSLFLDRFLVLIYLWALSVIKSDIMSRHNWAITTLSWALIICSICVFWQSQTFMVIFIYLWCDYIAYMKASLKRKNRLMGSVFFSNLI
jgi:hypothetical protein